jgi:hypothetical protein
MPSSASVAGSGTVKPALPDTLKVVKTDPPPIIVFRTSRGVIRLVSIPVKRLLHGVAAPTPSDTNPENNMLTFVPPSAFAVNSTGEPATTMHDCPVVSPAQFVPLLGALGAVRLVKEKSIGGIAGSVMN